MITELKMVVRTKSGGMFTACSFCGVVGAGYTKTFKNVNSLSRDGLIHRVEMKINNVAAVNARRMIANSGERKILSPRNLQFTVHLKRNCLPKSNDRVK